MSGEADRTHPDNEVAKPAVNLETHLGKLHLGSPDPRELLKSWLGKTLKIVITDGRIIVGTFVCTDREGNIILECAWDYTKTIESEYLKEQTRC